MYEVNVILQVDSANFTVGIDANPIAGKGRTIRVCVGSGSGRGLVWVIIFFKYRCIFSVK